MLEYLIIFLFALFFAAFFSGIETGIIKTDNILLSPFLKRKSARAKKFLHYIQHKDEMLSLTLIGTNLSVTIAATIATSALLNLFNMENKASIFVVAIITPIILILGEILPKTFFLTNTVSRILFVIPLISFFHLLLLPIVKLVTFVTESFINMIPERLKTKRNLSREDLKLLLELIENKSVSDNYERQYIKSYLTFYHTVAREIMKPLVDLVSVSADEKTFVAVNQIIQSGYSRLPVYSKSKDNIIGIVYAREILLSCSERNFENVLPNELIRPALFSPGSKRIHVLMSEFQIKHQNSAIILNEYGFAEGLVTMEDILEEIFGEIYDEFDSSAFNLINSIGKNVFLASGKTTIEQINHTLNLNIKKEHFETLAGYILKIIGRIPKTGDIIYDNKLKFKILKSDKRKIDLIRLEIINQIE